MTKSSFVRITAVSAAAASKAAVSLPRRPAFCRHMPRIASAALPTTTTIGVAAPTARSSARFYHVSSASVLPRRPRLASASVVSSSSPWTLAGRGRRTIFIQTENTPNADAIKFLPNHQVLPADISAPFIEYLNPRSTIAPPYPSPLAAQLMNVDGVQAVFYGSDFITITKAPEANWAHIRPEVFALITETITSGQTIVRPSAAVEGAANIGATAGGASAAAATEDVHRDTLEYDENDSEVVGMIKELLETRIRPAIQEDGGDIEFRGFEDGHVFLKLRGACRTCDSSTVTLKNGIESMLMHYIEEVQGVTQVLDKEEEVALAEFAKFEEKLRQQKSSVPPSTTDNKGTLNTVVG